MNRFLNWRPFNGNLWWDYTVLELTIGTMGFVPCGAAVLLRATQL